MGSLFQKSIVCILSAAQAITNNYHVVTDYNLRRLDGGLVTRMDHLESKLRVSFNADGQTFESDLELNHDLYNDFAYKGQLDGLDGHMRLTVLAPHEFHAMIKLESGDIWIIDPTHRHLTQASSAMVAYHTDGVMDTEVQHRLGESEYGNYTEMQICDGIAAGFFEWFYASETLVSQILLVLVTSPLLYIGIVFTLEWYCWYRHEQAEVKGETTEVVTNECPSKTNRVLFCGPRAKLIERIYIATSHAPMLQHLRCF